MFCLLCDREEKLYDGLCKSCYLNEFQAVEVPDYVTFTVCSHCGATLKENKWIQVGYYDDEIINDAIQKDITVNDKLEDVEIFTEITNNRGTVYECILHVNGTVINSPITNKYQFEVKVEKGVCPDCSKFHSGYYEAVIQLRADERRLDDKEIEETDVFIANKIQKLCKTNKLAYVSERIVLKEGVDYHVGSYNAAHKIALDLQKKFGGIITESRKLIGFDKSKSRDLYRSWISLRLPSFHKDDFIEYEKKIYRIERIGSHKFVAVNISSYNEESISWKEYDKINKIADTNDVKTTTITNITPNQIQVLDPDTYETIEFERIEQMNSYNIGDEINTIKIKNRLYLSI